MLGGICWTGKPAVSINLLLASRQYTVASCNSISSTISDLPIVETSSNFKHNGSHGDRNSVIKGQEL